MDSVPANDDELARIYDAHFQQLSVLAAELGIPPDEAPDLIQSVLLGSLHSPRTDLGQWLAAALTAAARQRVGER